MADQAVLLHLSDLHFGEVLLNNQFPFRPLRGFAAHESMLCQALMTATEDVRAHLHLEDQEEYRIIISGDLTTSGTPKEYGVAHSYVRSRWCLGRELPGIVWAGKSPHLYLVGLGAESERVACIPGNHDHWDGRRRPPPAYNPRVFPLQFRPCPWRKVWRSPGGTLELELYGVDSNSGLQNQLSNLRAKGRVSSQEMQQLEALVDESDRKAPPAGCIRVRAMVIHHSLSYVGSKLTHATELDSQSRADLITFAWDHSIGAVLTGHTHDFDFQLFTRRDQSLPHAEVHELRSASTFQGPAAQGKNGFLVHRVVVDGSVALWSTWRYIWNGSRFVRKANQPCLQFKVG
ncbi:MAG TPA: metallophosphoesterase [Candidatus Dormibacteraeota bacterium]|nr:metallophosphoesterase [Candidatus Dormibacteraeota bacterium]